MKTLFITFIVASASILYEFFLTHTMISLIGGTVTQYTICIGIFTFSLGLGAIFYSQNKIKPDVENFQNLEIILACFGSLSPLLLLFLFKVIGLSLVFISICYFTIFMIGFLSGIELPFLMDLYNKKDNSYSGKVLFVDYLGTLFGAIIYPLFLIENFDLFSLSLIIGLLNLITALLINHKNKLIIFIITIFVLTIINNENLFFQVLNFIFKFH